MSASEEVAAQNVLASASVVGRGLALDALFHRVLGPGCGNPRCVVCVSAVELDVQLPAAEIVAEHRGDVEAARAAGYFGGEQ